jgi:hypothetical protein
MIKLVFYFFFSFIETILFNLIKSMQEISSTPPIVEGMDDCNGRSFLGKIFQVLKCHLWNILSGAFLVKIFQVLKCHLWNILSGAIQIKQPAVPIIWSCQLLKLVGVKAISWL